MAAVALGALLLTGCQLPTFGAYKGATSQARSTFHLWQGFFIAGIIVGGFVLILISGSSSATGGGPTRCRDRPSTTP